MRDALMYKIELGSNTFRQNEKCWELVRRLDELVRASVIMWLE